MKFNSAFKGLKQ